MIKFSKPLIWIAWYIFCVLNFVLGSFEIVSKFGFRISDLGIIGWGLQSRLKI